MGSLRKFKRNISPYRQAIAIAMQKKVKELAEEQKIEGKVTLEDVVKVIAEKVEKEETKNTSCLPEDPLITGGAPPSDYPENQGMGNAIGRALEEKK